MVPRKQKIAVIGGGVGAITSVYTLTQTKDWQDKFDTTVYQMGWLCGEKGASGRNGNHGQRIEEHGLHVWGRFYDKAFRNMRSCYEQLESLGLRHKDDPLGTLEKDEELQCAEIDFECEKQPPHGGECCRRKLGKDFDTVILGASNASQPEVLQNVG